MDKYEHWLPKVLGKLFGNPRWAITLGQTAYYSVTEPEVSERWRRHEDCHKLQWAREGRVKFAVKYFVEWGYNLVEYRNLNTAYRNISYEVEARAAEKTDTEER